MVYNLILYRTYLVFKNNCEEKKIGYFDIKNYKIQNNYLIITTKYNQIYTFKHLDINTIYKKLNKYLINLKFDMTIGELIVNNINYKWECMICMDYDKKDEIIKTRCCKNLFHLNCFLYYLKQNDNFNCPIL